MTYLIYTTESAAQFRAEAEGQAQNLPYYRNPQTGVTRYLSTPQETADGKWALEVSGYGLTEDEEEKVVESVEWPEEEI